MGKFTQQELDGLDLSDLDTNEYDNDIENQGPEENN